MTTKTKTAEQFVTMLRASALAEAIIDRVQEVSIADVRQMLHEEMAWDNGWDIEPGSILEMRPGAVRGLYLQYLCGPLAAGVVEDEDVLPALLDAFDDEDTMNGLREVLEENGVDLPDELSLRKKLAAEVIHVMQSKRPISGLVTDKTPGGQNTGYLSDGTPVRRDEFILVALRALAS